MIDENRKEGQKPIRIAILDTGIDITHPQLQAALGKGTIKDYKGFPETLNPLCDGHGHGTHCTSVLLKTAPNAVLYIARVADDNGELSSDSSYLHVVNVSSSSSFVD